MNRVAIITGSSRGIGRAIAMKLAELGWNVVVNYNRDEAAAGEVVAAMAESGAVGLAVRANIAFAGERGKLLQETLRRFERVDLLVNNAGMAPRHRVDVLEATEASYDEVMAVNLKGPFFLSQLVAREMIQLKRAGKIAAPKIVNLGSVSAYASSINRAEYCLAKAGIAMMTRLLAHRLAEEGINVYEVRPGIIATDMTSVAKEKYDRLLADGLTPIARWGQPADVALAVAAIAQDYLPFSTGEVINVDGGFHLRRL